MNKSFFKRLRLEIRKDLFSFTFKVVKWLAITSCDSSLPLHPFETLCERLQWIMDHNGADYLIKYVKAIRGNLYNYLSGNPLRNSLSRCTTDGIPVVLGDLIPLIRSGNMRVIALILTVLTATRSLKISSQPDTSTITQPVKGDVPDLTKYMADFWRQLGYRPTASRPRKLAVKAKTYRLSQGPNGRALNTALVDIQYMPPKLVKALKAMSPKVGHLLNTFGNSELVSFFDKLSKGFVNDKKTCRRLSSFPDKEGKVRVIGVLDHYSQITLKPLHTWLSRALSKIRQDCTLDQSKFKELLLNNPKVDQFYSVDLSAATDRFPIELIVQLLKHQLPNDYVDAWKEVMVGTPFEFKGAYFTYAAGNPMGAYSSFNSFALTHHFIIYHCCRTLGICYKTLPYALLGDDIVIGDSRVGELYMKVISSLHVEYSMAKTHRSLHFFEFAKRIFYKGVEISPFPVSALKEVSKSLSAFANLLLEQRDRDWNFITISSSAAMFFKVVLNIRSKLVNKYTKGVENCAGVLSLVRGLQDGEQFLNNFARTLQLPLPHINMEICKNIIANIAVEAFSESSLHSYFSSSDSSKLPLWQLVTKWKKEWDEYIEDNFWESSSFDIARYQALFSDTPIYYALMAIIEEYEELMKRIEKIDSTGSDWSYYMRNFALPTNTNTVLIGNQKFQTMRSIDRFASMIEERLQIINMYPQLLEM